MRTLILSFITAMLALVSTQASANPLVETTQRCLADNTTGKDRKQLARWVFLSMSAHPELRDISALRANAVDESSRYVGALFTRLIADNCANEIGAMVKQGGPQSIELAFSFLGQVAVRELMTDAGVAKTLSAFERYVDPTKINPVLQQR
jgi:hypothetical protein